MDLGLHMREVNLKHAGLLFPSVVVLATCTDKEGRPNIITLGWAMKTSGWPPMVAISVAPARYSHKLLEETGEFVLAIPTKEIIEKVHKCGRTSGRRINKFEAFGLTPLPAKKVRAPLIKECVANLECKIVAKMKTGDHTLFIGEVVAAHVREEYFDTQRNCLDLDKARVIITHSDEYREAGNIIAYKLDGDIRLIKKQGKK